MKRYIVDNDKIIEAKYPEGRTVLYKGFDEYSEAEILFVQVGHSIFKAVPLNEGETVEEAWLSIKDDL